MKNIKLFEEFNDGDEMRDDEVLVGNIKDDEEYPKEHLKDLKTLRKGKIAYDINGKLLPGYLPVFINKSEIDKYGKLMQNQTRREVAEIRKNANPYNR